ncbi:response regulator [Phenylobacterium sp.]|uniref:response regulator n=1 Tax=Phenylobacterium sp. TaxID=1871053 RepID=UPI002EDACD76
MPRSAQSAQAQLRSVSPAATTPDRALRVLAAEDNATNQLVLRALLEPLGVQLTLVADGVQAVEASSTGAFDLVLMDIQMPVMDGLEATAAIRDQERAAGRPSVPIIALTANAMRHHLEAYGAAGPTAHVAKPIDATLLYAAIEFALSAGDPAADRTDAAMA